MQAMINLAMTFALTDTMPKWMVCDWRPVFDVVRVPGPGEAKRTNIRST